MKDDVKNKQCQICKGYLFPDDDVVVCPICGAPHHRDCYHTVGHCGVEELHGTSEQYDLQQQKIAEEQKVEENDEGTNTCSFCGRQSKTGNAPFCPYCGQPFSKNQQGAPKIFFNGMPVQFLDRCGGVPKDTKIEDVTADELAKFVGNNSTRYVPKFATLNENKKTSWNWAAFLFPAAWSFGRKMYSNGILYLLLLIASELCFIPLNLELLNIGDTAGMTFTQLYAFIEKNISAISLLSIIMCFVGLVLNLLPRLFCGRYGDWHYRKKCINAVKEIKADPETENLDEELHLSGSFNLLLGVIALLAQTYLPSIIAFFIL